MKKIIIILLFTFCWTCGYSQGNKRIIEICDSLLGKKVLRGYCGDFTYYVLNKLTDDEVKKYVDIFKWKDKFPYDLTLYSGDQILIKKGVKLPETDLYNEMKFKRGHIAFIHHWIDDCTVALIHQYIPKSVCIEKFEICKMYKGKIEITRIYEK
mgnify:CR=1 FL=1